MFNATIVEGAAQSVVLFGRAVQPPSGNSAGIAGAVRGIGQLVGADFGRYENGALDGTPSLAPVDPTLPLIDQVEAAVAEMLAARIAAQTTLTDAIDAAVEAADLIAYPPTAFVAAVAAVTEALRASINDPSGQIQALTPLASFDPTPPPNSAPVGQAIALLWRQEASICRRAALVSLARASAIYLPVSSADAATVRASICALLDSEITIAGDNEESQTYASFRALRTAVARDLSVRGSSAPNLATFTYPSPMPALTLAYALWGDATRARDLVIRCAGAMSLFMPLTVEAPAD